MPWIITGNLRAVDGLTMKVSMLKVGMKLFPFTDNTEEDVWYSPSSQTPNNQGKRSAALPTQRDDRRLGSEHDVMILEK